jgi:hypothetical protein
MSDRGRHFNNAIVQEFCTKWNCKTHVIAAYSLWVSGIETTTQRGTNKAPDCIYNCCRLHVA